MIHPSVSDREDTILLTIRTIHTLGTPRRYSNNPTANLIELTSQVVTLAEEIRANTSPDKPSSYRLNNSASAIAAFCFTELDKMDEGTKAASITEVQGAAEYAIRSGYPLDRLDLDLNPTERIARLIEAIGHLAPYWQLRSTPSPAEVHYRREYLATLGYHAICAIISANRWNN